LTRASALYIPLPAPKTVWITGAGGLIGSHLVRTAPQSSPGIAAIGLTRARFDLTDSAAVRTAFQESPPDAVIHCAALSKTNDCEANPALARKLNVEVTRFLAELAADIPFLCFSTDLVFDGRAGNYDENAPVNPMSVYAGTKVEAEQLVLRNPRHSVIRTSLNGGESATGHAFNEELRHAWKIGQTLRLFVDEFRSPIPAVVTARAVWELLASAPPGIYHVAGSERLSRCEIGRLLAARWPQLSPKIEPASLKEHRGAPRCPDTSLNCTKAQRLLSFPLPRWSDYLVQHPNEVF
jgi:dTDP-4-dehydrorhamnose reductase